MDYSEKQPRSPLPGVLVAAIGTSILFTASLMVLRIFARQGMPPLEAAIAVAVCAGTFYLSTMWSVVHALARRISDCIITLILAAGIILPLGFAVSALRAGAFTLIGAFALLTASTAGAGYLIMRSRHRERFTSVIPLIVNLVVLGAFLLTVLWMINASDGHL